VLDRRCSVWIGFDDREVAAFAVARHSAKRRMSTRLPIGGVVLDDLRGRGFYSREMQERLGADGTKILWDPISDAPCSTQFAISRFCVPFLAETGWALFVDCDVLIRVSVSRLFEQLDPRYAVYCVKHPEMPGVSGTKMQGQPQTPYTRKLWSSVMVWNVDHPANRALTVEAVNSLPGRDLHRLFWLDDDQIGELGPEWNHLVGINPMPDLAPRIVHFTQGIPLFPGYEECDFADEWRKELAHWASGA